MLGNGWGDFTFGMDEARFHHYLLLAMLASGPIGFIMTHLLSFEAPYGRHQPVGEMWKFFPVGPRTAWFIQESPTIFVSLWYFYHSRGECYGSVPNRILFWMYYAHYVNRVFIYPAGIRGGKPTPFVIMALAFLFCWANTYLQIRDLTYFTVYPSDWVYDPRFVIGCAMFLSGFVVNNHADEVLRNLRAPWETGYKIPYGGAFSYVSAANYFGEILEWLGFGIACWSPAALTFAFFTLCTLAPRGHRHHMHYLSTFKNYPRERKAVIPFLW